MDTMVKLVLVFFLTILSFSIGAYVGKQFSDTQHKMAASEIFNDESRETASIPSEGTTIEPKSAISPEELAKLEKFDQEDQPTEHEHGMPSDGATTAKNGGGHGEKDSHNKSKAGSNDHHEAKPDVHHEAKAEHGKTAHSVKSVKEEIKKLKDDITVAAESVAKERTLVPSHTERMPSNLPEETANSMVGKYMIQIVSFPHEKEAKAKAQELIGKGFSAFYVAADVKDKTWYRVGVGRFPNRDQAQKYKTKFEQESGIQSSIISKIGHN